MEPDVNEPNPSRNAKMDRLIAAYLAKDYFEDEDSDDSSYFLPEEKKKSYFRERDAKTGELFAFVLCPDCVKKIISSGSFLN